MAKVLNVEPITLLVLAAGLRSSVSTDRVCTKLHRSLPRLSSLGLVGEFAEEFSDGKLKSRPSGSQVSLERLSAVLA